MFVCVHHRSAPEQWSLHHTLERDVSRLSRSLLLLLLLLSLLLRSSRIRGFCIRHFSLLVGQFCVFVIAVPLAIFSKLNFFFPFSFF